MLVHRKVLTNLKVPFVFRRSVPLQFLPLFFLICGPTFVDILEHVFADWLWVGGCAHLFSTHTHTQARWFVVCGTLFSYVCTFCLFLGASRDWFISRKLANLVGICVVCYVLLRGGSGLSFARRRDPEWQQEKMAAHAKNIHTDTNAHQHSHTRARKFLFFFSALVLFFCPFLSTFSDSRILSFFSASDSV